MIPIDFKLNEEGEALRARIALRVALHKELDNEIGRLVREFERLRQDQWFESCERTMESNGRDDSKG